jgi:hypothetical protein
MREPLRGCDPSVDASHVFDGAQVTIRDQSGATVTAGFDLSAVRFILPSPLREGDELVIEQHFQHERMRPATPSSRSACPMTSATGSAIAAEMAPFVSSMISAPNWHIC